MRGLVILFLALAACKTTREDKKPEAQVDQEGDPAFQSIVVQLLPAYCSVVMNDTVISTSYIDGKTVYEDKEILTSGRRYLDSGPGEVYTKVGDRHRIPEDMKDKECSSNKGPLTAVFITDYKLFKDKTLSGDPVCTFKLGDTLDGDYKINGTAEKQADSNEAIEALGGKTVEEKCGVPVAYGLAVAPVGKLPRLLELIKKN